MDSARWERIQELFHQAADRPPNAQRAFLEEACEGEKDLIDDVLSMLEEDAHGASPLDGDVAVFADRILSPSGQDGIPERFGPYRLRKLLGAGGMGVVYLAEREDLRSLVAIKFLRDAWMSPARRQRFAAEQRTLAQLNHPSIARLYDANTLPDGTPWFVMEYVEGTTLTDYCRLRNASIEERLRIFRSVCEAVQHAHQHAVIHRDLKPSNILVKADGSVRLLDFGIAKQLAESDRPMDQTRTELRLMTPAYAAPEQIRGEPVGIYTDVYALGVVLYELLTGRPPYDLSNSTPAQAERIIAEQAPEKPSAVVWRAKTQERGVSRTSWDDLDVLCLTAMHKEAGRRYGSVEALLRDIDRYLGGEPLEARPDTLHYRAGKFVRRHARAVAVTAGVLALVIGMAVFFTVRLAIARNAALTAATRSQRVQQFMLNLFQGGDKSAAPSETLRVVTLLDRGVQEARALQREPGVQADLFETLGGIYQKLGNLPRADTLLQSALDRRKALYGSENALTAENVVALGLLRVDQARLNDAEHLVRDGLERTKRARPRDDAAIAKATMALGRVLEARGHYTEAIPVLQQAVKLQSAISPGSVDLASSLKELADTYFYAGKYALCDSLTRQSMAIHRQLFGDRHPLVADDLVNLGAVQHDLGHYAEAEGYYGKALAITKDWYGKDNPETASVLSMLARTLEFENRFDESENLLEQALAIQERAYGPVHPHVASILNELGGVALQRNRYDEAKARFERIVDIYRAVYGDHHYLVALGLANLASVYLAAKDYPRAEMMFRDVVRRYSEALSPDNLNAGIAQIKLGRAILRQRRYREAEEHTLAGYRILAKQTSPSINWLQAARQDLVADYTALGQSTEAKKYESEWVANGGRLDARASGTK